MPSKGDIKFGQLAVEMEYASKDKIEDALRLQAQLEKQGKVTSLDRIMLKKGILDLEQIQEIEKKQGRRIVFCPECSNKLNVAIFGPGTRIRCPKCDTSLTVPANVKYEVVDRKEPPKKAAKAEREKQDTIKVKKVAGPSPKKKKEEKLDDEIELLDDGPANELDDAAAVLSGGKKGGGDEEKLADDVEVLDEGGDDDLGGDDLGGDDDLAGDEAGDEGGDAAEEKGDDDVEVLDESEDGPAKPAPKKPGGRMDKFKKK